MRFTNILIPIRKYKEFNMTLSYAAAMKKEPQQAPIPERTKESTAPFTSTAKASLISGNKLQGSASKLGRGSILVSETPTSTQAPRSASNPWGNQTKNIESKNSQSLSNMSEKGLTKASPKQIPASTTWNTIARNQRAKSPQPIQILRNNKSPPKLKAVNSNNPKPVQTINHKMSATKSVDTKPSGQSSQLPKSKKPKPKLKAMSMFDLISEPKKMGITTASKVTIQTQESLKSKMSLQVDSSKEFPALGSAPAQTSIPKLATWGTKSSSPGASQKAPKYVTPVKEQNKAPKKDSRKKEKPKLGNTPVSPKMSTAMFFKPRVPENRVGDGDEHELLRLMQERTVYTKKGRQRVAPRKKKFTALKKKVLQERLNKWRELHPEEVARKSPATKISALNNRETCSICVYQYASVDSIEDDDEYEEILEDLKDLAAKIGEVEEVFIPRNLSRLEDYPAFLRFKTPASASAALACWEGLVIGGESLHVVPIHESSIVRGERSAQEWSDKMLAAEVNLKRSGDAILEDADVGPSTIVLRRVLTKDDFEDEDCMSESLEDLKRIAEQYGKVLELRSSEARDGNVEILYEASSEDALIIVDKFCKTLVSGEALSAFIQEKTTPTKDFSVVVLENVLTEDDLEDEDCLNETLNDIQELTARYGQVSSVVAEGSAVKVTYAGGLSVAQTSASELNGLCLGGMTVSAKVLDREKNENVYLYIQNLLNDDDLEDEECLEESLNDIRNLVSKIGQVLTMDVIQNGGSGVVRILFAESKATATKAAAELNGTVFGGQVISATLDTSPEEQVVESGLGGNIDTQDSRPNSESSGEKRKPSEDDPSTTVKKPRTTDPTPLFSGDKLIPERFAECKRVPKIPNQSGPREYAKLVNDERVKPLLIEMLGELMRLQKRAMEDKNAKARRRIVMGLREVARGIRAHKVRMVVMANNLDQYGAIDEKLQEIIDLAYSEDVPLFFEFSKRNLGKAVGKSIKVAVVGVQNADGAHAPFKKLMSIAAKT